MSQNRFEFKILTGNNKQACQIKFDNIQSKDPYTFYLFDHGGIGYLGNTQLFGKDSHKFNILTSADSNTNYSDLNPNQIYFVTDNITLVDDITDANDPQNVSIPANSIWVTDNYSSPSEMSWNMFNSYMARYITNSAIHNASIDPNYSPTDNTLMTAQAILSLINREINAQAILNISFFKNVSDAITVEDSDIRNRHISVTFDGTTYYNVDIDTNTVHAGDIGIVFEIQYGPEFTPSQDSNDHFVFLNLHGLINLYTAGQSNTTTVTVENAVGAQHTKQIKVEVNKSTMTGWNDKIKRAINSVVINTAYDPESTDNMSNNKFITESQLASILVDVLKDFVQYNIE